MKYIFLKSEEKFKLDGKSYQRVKHTKTYVSCF